MGFKVDYNHLWGNNKIIDYRVWPTWGLMEQLFENGGNFLEIGAGNRPRIPIKGSYFIDTSFEAIENLNRIGGKAQVASAESLPFKDKTFDVVCAFEIIEHVKEDKKALNEIFRVLKSDGRLILSVPLKMKCWSPWDDLAGHYRRYEPDELETKLEEVGFKIKKFFPGQNFTVLRHYFWLGRIGIRVYRLFPKPFMFFEHILVASVVKLETKIGAFRGLKWQEGEFARVGEDKTSAILMCTKIY